MKYLLD